MEKKGRELLSHFLAFLTGSGIGLILFSVLNFNFLFALLFGLSGYTLTMLFVFPGRQDHKLLMKKGYDLLKQLKTQSTQLAGKIVQNQVTSLYETGAKIMTALKSNSKNLPAAQQFISYELDRTVAIVEKYLALTRVESHAPRIRSSLEKAEKMLEKLTIVYAKKLEDLFSDDVHDLEAELQMLEETLDVSGDELPDDKT